MHSAKNRLSGSMARTILDGAVPCRHAHGDAKADVEIQNLIHSSPEDRGQEASDSLHHIHQCLRLMSYLGANSNLCGQKSRSRKGGRGFPAPMADRTPASQFLFGLNQVLSMARKTMAVRKLAAAAIEIRNNKLSLANLRGANDAALTAEITARIDGPES